MQTEFKCGIYKAMPSGLGWAVTVNMYTLAAISPDGADIKFSELPIHLTSDSLIEIAVLMNNIKRQYKQLQTTS